MKSLEYQLPSRSETLNKIYYDSNCNNFQRLKQLNHSNDIDLYSFKKSGLFKKVPGNRVFLSVTENLKNTYIPIIELVPCDDLLDIKIQKKDECISMLHQKGDSYSIDSLKDKQQEKLLGDAFVTSDILMMPKELESSSSVHDVEVKDVRSALTVLKDNPSQFLWMLKDRAALRCPDANTKSKSTSSADDAEAVVNMHVPIDETEASTTFHENDTLSTSQLYEYAQCIIAAHRALARGVLPPAPLFEKLAELLKIDQLAPMLSNFPSLADILQTSPSSEQEKQRIEKELEFRRRLVSYITKGKEPEILQRCLFLTDDVRKDAEWELRLLQLRKFQKTLRDQLFINKAEYGQELTQNKDTFNQKIMNGLLQLENQCDFPNSLSSSRTIELCIQPSLNDIMCFDGGGQQGPSVFHSVINECNETLTHSLPQQHIIRMKVNRFLRDLPLHFRNIKKRWLNFKDLSKQTTLESCRKAELIFQRKEAFREKDRKERMKLLKEKDFVKYLEMVKQSKNARIEELLAQTDKFLNSVACRINAQQEATKLGRLTTAQDRIQHQTSIQADQNNVRKNKLLKKHLEVIDTDINKDGTYKNDISTVDLNTNDESGSSLLRAVTHDNLTETVVQPSLLVGGKLMPYQLAGLQFLVNLCTSNLSGILADEMGLGKTIQTIALLAYLQEFKSIGGPHLIIVPLSTLPNWIAEFERWCPSLNVVEFRGNRQERRQLSRSIRTGEFNVCLTTYDWVLREKAVLSIPYWFFIVVDEGHRMKNARSKFHVTLAEFKSSHRLLLTGTPLQNNLVELWSLLNFLLPRIFTSATDFEMWFEEPFRNFPGQEAVELSEEEKFLIINRLHAVLRPFLLRRVKEDVLGDLPCKREYIVRVQLSAWQKRAYEQLSKKALKIQTIEGKVSYRSFANVMVQLRKIVNHPYLFEEEYYINSNLYRVSGKFEVLDRMLPKLINFNHKTLIFCQMTQLMDILDDYLELKGYERCRLDGSTLLEERKERTANFNDPSSKILIFLLSTRAGGLGLNLQAADTVIIFDSDWNPHQDLQAQARAHRLGQKNEVRVFKLVTVSGIEEAVLSKAQHKLDIDEKIIQAGMFNNRCTEEEREKRLRMLLGSKDTDVDARVTTPQELNRFMARTEEEEEFFQNYDEELFGAEAFRAFEEHCPLPISTFKNDNDSSLQEEDEVQLDNNDHQNNYGWPSSHLVVSHRPITRHQKKLAQAAAATTTEKSVMDSSTSLTAGDYDIKNDSRTTKISINSYVPESSPSDNNRDECDEDYKWKKNNNSRTFSSRQATLRQKQNKLVKREIGKPNTKKKSLEGGDDVSGNSLLEQNNGIITEEDLLIKTDRLMSYDEIPLGWIDDQVVVDHDNICSSPTTCSTDQRPMRRHRSDVRRLSVESLSEASFARALKLLETGEVTDFETAISIEKSKSDQRRTRIRTSTMSKDDESSSTYETARKRRRRECSTTEMDTEIIHSHSSSDDNTTNTNEEDNVDEFSSSSNKSGRQSSSSEPYGGGVKPSAALVSVCSHQAQDTQKYKRPKICTNIKVENSVILDSSEQDKGLRRDRTRKKQESIELNREKLSKPRRVVLRHSLPASHNNTLINKMEKSQNTFTAAKCVDRDSQPVDTHHHVGDPNASSFLEKNKKKRISPPLIITGDNNLSLSSSPNHLLTSPPTVKTSSHSRKSLPSKPFSRGRKSLGDNNNNQPQQKNHLSNLPTTTYSIRKTVSQTLTADANPSSSRKLKSSFNGKTSSNHKNYKIVVKNSTSSDSKNLILEDNTNKVSKLTTDNDSSSNNIMHHEKTALPSISPNRRHDICNNSKRFSFNPSNNKRHNVVLLETDVSSTTPWKSTTTTTSCAPSETKDTNNSRTLLSPPHLEKRIVRSRKSTV